MRKKSRFSPSLIRSLLEEKRGTGVFEDFTPFHQVQRRDPPSRGLSAIVPARGKFSAGDQLSTAEQICYEFCRMVEDLDDLRHQVRLQTDRHWNCLFDYAESVDEQTYPGTREICDNLCIRPPELKQGDDSEEWIHSTDLVLTLKPPSQGRRILAVSVKDVPFVQLTRRKRNLLLVEREYWLGQGHDWLLITPESYCPTVGEAVRRGAGFVRGYEPQDDAHLARAAAIVRARERSLTGHLYNLMGDFSCSMEKAQGLFWQAVWSSLIPIDWTTTLWPTDAVRLVSKDEFDAFNPVTSRRSAWPR